MSWSQSVDLGRSRGALLVAVLIVGAAAQSSAQERTPQPADALLERFIRAGYTDARLVVDR